MVSQIDHIPAVNSAGMPAPSAPMTYEQFLNWVDEDTRAEWVAGRVIMASPATYPHQRIIAWFDRIVGLFANALELGEVLPAGYNMKITKAGREPDVLFIRSDHRNRVQHSYLDGPADLVVEVVSPESRERDYTTKREEYDERDVGEYWLIDPISRGQLFYQRSELGRLAEVSPIDGVIESAAIPGFRLPVAWIWNPPPDLEVLEWLKVGVSYEKWTALQTELIAERGRANAERERADAERERADAERQRADSEGARAEAERARAEHLAARLRDLGVNPE